MVFRKEKFCEIKIDDVEENNSSYCVTHGVERVTYSRKSAKQKDELQTFESNLPFTKIEIK